MKKRLVGNKYYDYYYNDMWLVRVVYTLDEDGAFDDVQNVFNTEDEAKLYIRNLCA